MFHFTEQAALPLYLFSHLSSNMTVNDNETTSIHVSTHIFRDGDLCSFTAVFSKWHALATADVGL